MGRKKIDTKDKKEVVNIYLKKSEIDLLGGKESIINIALNAIQKEIKDGKYI